MAKIENKYFHHDLRQAYEDGYTTGYEVAKGECEVKIMKKSGCESSSKDGITTITCNIDPTNY